MTHLVAANSVFVEESCFIRVALVAANFLLRRSASTDFALVFACDSLASSCFAVFNSPALAGWV